MLNDNTFLKNKKSSLTDNQKRGEMRLAFTLSTTLCIAQQNRSIGVNVVCDGSPSRMRRVRLISLGMTILPKSSTRLTMPVAFIYFLSS